MALALAATALLIGEQRLLSAPGEHDPLPALAAVLGLLLDRPGSLRPAVGLAALVLVALAALLPLAGPPAALLAAAPALLAGAMLGAALRATPFDRPAAALVACAGAAIPLAGAALLPETAPAGAALVWLALIAGGLGLRRGRAPDAPPPAARSARGARGSAPEPAAQGGIPHGAAAAASGLLLGLLLMVGACGLALHGLAAWSRAGAALALGLLVGGLGGRWLESGWRTWVVSLLLGAGLLLLVGRRIPLGSATELGLLLGLAGVAVGAGLTGPLRGGGGRGLAAAALAPLLAGPVLGLVASWWTPHERLERFGLVRGEPEPGDEETKHVRWERLGPPSVHVIELEKPRSGAVRLLMVDGRLRGLTPARHGDDPQLLAAVSLQGGLAGALSAESPTAVGLGTGVAIHLALLTSPGRPLAVTEPVAGIRALLDDPGEPFGPFNGHLAARRDELRLLARGSREALRAAPAGVVLLEPPDPDPALVALGLGSAGAVVVRITPDLLRIDGSESRLPPLLERLRRVIPAGAPTWAFAPVKDGELVLVVGPERLDAAAVLARAEPAPVASALGLAGLAPIDLLATCVADPAGVERALAEGTDAGLAALLARGAQGDGPAFGLPEDGQAAAGLLLDLAEAAGRRRLPAAVPWVRQALSRRRDARTLQAWGDLLYRDDERREEALSIWREALAADRGAVGPRISLATHLRNQGKNPEALATLREGLTGDAAHDEPLHYLEAEVLEVMSDDAGAATAFEKAGTHRDARARAEAARERARGGKAAGLTAAQRLEAARELLDRARGATPAEAEQRRVDALALVLPLGREANLGADHRRQAARLLDRLSEGESVAALRQNIHRHAAELLAPLWEAKDRLERARLLVRAGDPLAAEALLPPLLEGPLAPRAHAVLGEALRARGETEAALAAWRRGLGLAPPSSGDVPVHLAIAELELLAGRPERSLAALDEAERQLPGLPRIRLERARLLDRMERASDALQAWRAWLEVAPRVDPAREEAARRIEALEGRVPR